MSEHNPYTIGHFSGEELAARGHPMARPDKLRDLSVLPCLDEALACCWLCSVDTFPPAIHLNPQSQSYCYLSQEDG